jgi:hypothetical protein
MPLSRSTRLTPTEACSRAELEDIFNNASRRTCLFGFREDVRVVGCFTARKIVVKKFQRV